jgi:uncharacterized protein (DUF2147 family)
MRCVITATVLVTASHSQPARPDDPNGTWLTEDGRARIRIERCGATLDQICGYIVWMNESVGANGQPLRDRHNPDPNKRFRLLLGHQLIMGMTQTVEGRFSGQIYNAENGSFYKIALWRDTSDRLKVKGCMLTVFCATQTWTQTTDVLPGQLIGLTGDVNGPKADKEWMPPKRPRSAGSLR